MFFLVGVGREDGRVSKHSPNHLDNLKLWLTHNWEFTWLPVQPHLSIYDESFSLSHDEEEEVDDDCPTLSVGLWLRDGIKMSLVTKQFYFITFSVDHSSTSIFGRAFVATKRRQDHVSSSSFTNRGGGLSSAKMIKLIESKHEGISFVRRNGWWKSA